MNAPLRSRTKHGFAVSNNRKAAATGGSRRLLPALLALGGTCGLVGGPASALELGPIAVQSTLGKPLRASIAYALNPRESIDDYCIYLKPGRTSSGLPSIDRASVALSNGTILLTGRDALREPLLSLQLAVDCPGAAQLTREYSVFLSPWLPSTQDEPKSAVPVTSSRAPTEVEPAMSVPTAPTNALPAPATSLSNVNPAPPAANDRSADRASIVRETTYRVQRGDTLSGIAQRISDRTVGIWQAVDIIFAANPDAFIDNNRDLLKAGSLLDIPGSLTAARSDQGAPESISAETAPSVQPATIQASSGDGYGDSAAAGASPASDGRAEARAPAETTSVVADVAQRNVSEAEASRSNGETSSVQTGDAASETSSPFASPVETASGSLSGASPFETPVEVIPETAIDQPAAEQPATADRNDNAANDSWSWLIWLGGSGVALILGMLLFGRTLKRRFGGNTDPIAAEPELNRRMTDARSGNESAMDNAADSGGFSFDEAAPQGDAIPLDGDLDVGTGFQDGGEIDVAQDFGFSAPDDLRLGLDLEFSDESGIRLKDEETAMLVAGQRTEDAIIVSETPPEYEETGNYDISTIVDDAQQPVREADETTKDLKALELDADDAGQADDDSYTLNEEVDYRILEQDYEDELTATQALSAELAQAARELRVDMNESKEKRDAGDSFNEEMTAEMPAAENDATAAMDIESAALDTKNPKAKKTGT